MSNQAEIDYDKQFQDDLAKATALSLEQQALDDYRRHKKYGTAYHHYQHVSSTTSAVGGVASREYYASLRAQHLARQHSTEPTHVSYAQRRHSEVHQSAVRSGNVERSRTPPPSTPAENDLICFASPTSKQPENASTFEKLIEDLQKMPATNPQSELVPLAVAPVHYAAPVGYQQPYAAATYAGMQLVPYQPPAPQRQVPLTNDELQRLYNMNHQMVAAPAHTGYIRPANAGGYVHYPVASAAAAAPPYSAPIVPGSAAYLPPQYPSHGYGFAVPTPALSTAYGASNGIGSTHVDFSRPHSLSAAVVATAVSQSAQPTRHAAEATANAAALSTSNVNTQRQTSPIFISSNNNSSSSSSRVPPQRSANDLIDLNQGDDSRVSVLEAFDPLLNENSVRQK